MPTIYKPIKTTRTYEGKRKERMVIYNSNIWRALRMAKLRDNPLCEMCEREGIVKPADDVHHIQSFMSVDDQDERIALAYDYDNLMSLCDECHTKVHNNNRLLK